MTSKPASPNATQINVTSFTDDLKASPVIFRYLSIVETLLENGAEADLKNKNGDVPLVAARRAGHLDVVEILQSRVPETDPGTPTTKPS